MKAMNNGKLMNETLIPKSFSAFLDSMLNDTLPAAERELVIRPKADIYEKNDSYELQLQLPGFTKEDIKVEVEEQKLTISGERKKPANAEGVKSLLMESYYGKMKRVFSLPKDAGDDKIQARFENGILYVTIAKAEGKGSRSIEIS